MDTFTHVYVMCVFLCTLYMCICVYTFGKSGKQISALIW